MFTSGQEALYIYLRRGRGLQTPGKGRGTQVAAWMVRRGHIPEAL